MRVTSRSVVIAESCGWLDAIEEGAGEDWLLALDKKLGRAFKPIDPPGSST